jgi:hypothetical protein
LWDAAAQTDRVVTRRAISHTCSDGDVNAVVHDQFGGRVRRAVPVDDALDVGERRTRRHSDVGRPRSTPLRAAVAS